LRNQVSHPYRMRNRIVKSEHFNQHIPSQIWTCFRPKIYDTMTKLTDLYGLSRDTEGNETVKGTL
jgi:hypothetical protein